MWCIKDTRWDAEAVVTNQIINRVDIPAVDCYATICQYFSIALCWYAESAFSSSWSPINRYPKSYARG